MTGKIINVVGNWGTIAVVLQFSWDRAAKWLHAGRPLSLIALDALILCIDANDNQHQSDYFQENPVYLINAAPIEIMAKTVSTYLEKDKVPRTKRAVNLIIKYLFGIT